MGTDTMATGGWHKVDAVDIPDDGRVRSVVVDGRTVALARCGLRLGALDDRCPHQGGPLGEGSIENGWLRCPWHGYDYDPISGKPPEGFSDGVTAYDVEERRDGVYVRLPQPPAPTRTVADVLVETLVAYGARHMFGMVGHSNLGFADAMRRAEQRGELTYIGIRHEGAAAFAASAYGKLTGRPAACFAIAGPGSTNLLTDLVTPVRRVPISGSSCAALAAAAGVDAGAPEGLYADGSGVAPDEVLDLDPAAARWLEDCWAAGDAALRRLARQEQPILWPEHFDVGILAGGVSFGVSPGDTHIGEPYAYVGPVPVRTTRSGTTRSAPRAPCAISTAATPTPSSPSSPTPAAGPRPADHTTPEVPDAQL